MSKKEIKNVAIDADHIAFLVAKSNTYKTGFEKCDDMDAEEMCQALMENELDGLEEVDPDLTKMQDHFKSIVADYILTAEVACICYGWELGITKVIMSDKSNFRYGLFDEYKANRKGNEVDEMMERLKLWAREYYHFEPDTEADDVVAYYVRNGYLGFTTDKDLFKGVKGVWYNSHFKHRCWLFTNETEAEHFFKMQILAGDRIDGIPALDGVGLITAEKLMKKYGSSYDDLLQIYSDKTKVLGQKQRPISYDKKYFETMVQLVCMSQWTPKKGIKLWRLKNS